MNILHEVNKGNLNIKCGVEDMGWGMDSKMRVKFPSFLTVTLWKSKKEDIRSIAKYCANKIHYALLTDAIGISKDIEQLHLDVPNNFYCTPLAYGDQQSAFIRPFLKSDNELEVSPYIEFNHADEYGFTLIPGSFSDFIITNRTGEDTFFGYTKDFHPMHFPIATLYLIQFCDLIERMILNGERVSDFEEFSDDMFFHTHPKIKSALGNIQKEIADKTSRNQGKKITTLLADGKNIHQLMRAKGITSSFHAQGPEALNIALALQLPLSTVSQYIREHYYGKSIV